MSPRGRQLAATALVVAASVALVLALLAGYARRAGVDSDQFANRATAALRDDSVRSLIAERITDQLVLANRPDLIAARPLIESAAASVVGSGAFTKLFRSAVRDVHRALFQKDEATLTLTVADVGTVVGAALEQLRPSLAEQVAATGRLSLGTRDIGSLSSTVANAAHRVKVLAFVLAALWLALVAAALVLSPDRRRTVVALGIGAATAGVLVIVAYNVTRSLAVHHVNGPDAQAAAGAVWNAFLGDLRTAAWIVAGSGAVVAAAAASLIKPVDLGEPLRRAGRRLATEPARPALRVVRAVGLIALGVIVLVARDAVLQLVLAVVGVYLVYEGVSALLRLVYRPAEEAEERERPRAGLRRLIAPLLAVGVVAFAVAAFVGAGGATTPAPAAGPCDGHAALCGRRLDQVAMAATHNSMSAPQPGYFSSQQDRPIAEQLRDGVRGLLIDTHYADRLSNGRVRTYFGSREELERAAQQDGVSQDAVDSALRIRERLGFSGKGERGIYLCHTFCELGAVPLAQVLGDLHEFLVAHPNEVVVVINQDYVTPADFVAAVQKAQLDRLVYRGPVGEGDWLTLRQMIDRDQRLVFLAENHAGAAAWYHLAYEHITEETPFSFKQVALLTDPAQLAASCKANRGPATAPLFLLNHWITTDPLPLPSNAEKVNAYAALLARARDCERVRHHIPNLVAVDFYRRGDVFRVVDTLNGVG